MISTTRNHPFFVNGEFKDAEQINIGEFLFSYNKTLLEVISLNYVPKTVKVYNFEVEENHCYFVGEDGVLVLNACNLLKKGKDALLKALKEVKNMTPKDIENAVKKHFPLLKKKGGSPDGRFADYVDAKGRTRLKVHPPDAKTPNSHIHIYNSKGNPLDKNLKVGNRRDPNVHIEILK